MKRVIFVLLVMFLLVSVNLWADTVEIPEGRLDWKKLDARTIVIYETDIELIVVEIHYAHIYKNSKIHFFDLTISPGSKVLIDGDVYDVKNVQKINALEIQNLYKEQQK